MLLDIKVQSNIDMIHDRLFTGICFNNITNRYLFGITSFAYKMLQRKIFSSYMKSLSLVDVLIVVRQTCY